METMEKIETNRTIQRIIDNQIKQRINCIKLCHSIYPVDQCINRDWRDNRYNRLFKEYKIEKVVSITYDDKNDPFIKIINERKLIPREIITGLAFNALNQFCFWFDRNDLSLRSLTSSDIGLPEINGSFDFLNKSLTLLKERTQLNYALRKYLLNIQVYSNIELIEYILDFDGFNFDIFRKKKELFLMFLFRYFDVLDLPAEFKKVSEFVNPAIDYQVPKMLRAYNIIDYPNHISKKIDAGKLIHKDSNEELIIRAISYYTLIDIQSKKEQICHNGIFKNIDQIDLDWFFWSKRNNPGLEYVKHHCTITEDY